MNILVVGNILKDVYLSPDPRTETFETDNDGTKWLDFSFDNSEHHYFHRISTLGGAAVTKEVLNNMGLEAEIVSSNLDDSANPTTYRYILTSDDSVAYFVPSRTTSTTFIPPDDSNVPDYIYVDRSASLDRTSATKIKTYLDTHMGTALILYLKDPNDKILSSLISQANLIISETELNNIPSDKLIYLSENSISYNEVIEPISVKRIDKLTHLSAYSIAAATTIGGFILGKSVEESLKLARLNVENANLDSTLSLKELENLTLNTSEDDDLELVAATLMAPYRGILAADESGGSIKKKFAELGIDDTFNNRHDYRNIFFATPNIEDYLNGIILFDETARDFADNGEDIPDFLTSKRIIPGIKVDQGLATFAELNEFSTADFSVSPALPEETYTKGLEDLPARLREYYQMGLRFAKWRAAFNITLDENGNIITPTDHAITENCRILAEYAMDCQSAGLVPIVEPEVVYDGDYSLDQSAFVTGKILDSLIRELSNFKVNFRATIIKVNMVIAGKKYYQSSTSEEVGAATAKVLKEHVPDNIAGIVFLSGGQTPEQATENLSEVLKNGPFPWPISFSFARALQDPALYAWNGNNKNTKKAEQAFLDRLKANTEVLKK